MMKKWAIAAVLYLVVVIVGYTVYVNAWETPPTQNHTPHSEGSDYK
ncbi:hypothetical protein [Radiobacillus deserti]|nr:hypothetical protein [Radiobacillus deserti]